MATSLYDLSVASYLQAVGAMSVILDHGLSHCSAQGIDPETLVEAHLIGDMLPFRFQVQCVAHHSVGACTALETGTFSPPHNPPLHDYAALQALIADTHTRLTAMTPDIVNSRAGNAVTFTSGNFTIPFTAENFVLSFSLPNLYFHAATAYDILRMKGVKLGKRDYMGSMRRVG